MFGPMVLFLGQSIWPVTIRVLTWLRLSIFHQEDFTCLKFSSQVPRAMSALD